EQARPVGTLEAIDVAAIEGEFRRRMDLPDHVGDRAAPAGSSKAADENVVSRSAELDAQFQSAESPFLADQIGDRFGVGRGFKGYCRRIATPPQPLGRQPSKQIR